MRCQQLGQPRATGPDAVRCSTLMHRFSCSRDSKHVSEEHHKSRYHQQGGENRVGCDSLDKARDHSNRYQCGGYIQSIVEVCEGSGLFGPSPYPGQMINAVFREQLNEQLNEQRSDEAHGKKVSPGCDLPYLHHYPAPPCLSDCYKFGQQQPSRYSSKPICRSCGIGNTPTTTHGFGATK